MLTWLVLQHSKKKALFFFHIKGNILDDEVLIETLDDSKKMIINNSLKLIIEKLESDAKRKLMLLIPNVLKNELGV